MLAFTYVALYACLRWQRVGGVDLTGVSKTPIFVGLPPTSIPTVAFCFAIISPRRRCDSGPKQSRAANRVLAAHHINRQHSLLSHCYYCDALPLCSGNPWANDVRSLVADDTVPRVWSASRRGRYSGERSAAGNRGRPSRIKPPQHGWRGPGQRFGLERASTQTLRGGAKSMAAGVCSFERRCLAAVLR